MRSRCLQDLRLWFINAVGQYLGCVPVTDPSGHRRGRRGRASLAFGVVALWSLAALPAFGQEAKVGEWLQSLEQR